MALAHPCCKLAARRALLSSAVALLAHAALMRLMLPLWATWVLREAMAFAMVACALRWQPTAATPAAAARSLRSATALALALIAAWLWARSCFLAVQEPHWPAATAATARVAAQALWAQSMGVALPEELFWRGYVQTALQARWPAQHRVAGAPFGWAALLTTALFALSHVVGGAPWPRLATFFPGLAFAWLQARHGSVAGPWLLHAACNLGALAAARCLPISPL